jgi:hypothetical protein
MTYTPLLPSTAGGTGLTSPGTSGNVLTSNGTTWTSAVPGGGGGSGSTVDLPFATTGLTAANATAIATANALGILTTQYESVTIQCDGTAWFIL